MNAAMIGVTHGLLRSRFAALNASLPGLPNTCADDVNHADRTWPRSDAL